MLKLSDEVNGDGRVCSEMLGGHQFKDKYVSVPDSKALECKIKLQGN